MRNGNGARTPWSETGATSSLGIRSHCHEALVPRYPKRLLYERVRPGPGGKVRCARIDRSSKNSTQYCI